MKYIINGLAFTTLNSIQQYAKEILYREKVGTILNKDDHIFMLDFFKTFHNEWEQKQGVGIAYIKRVKEPNYGKFNAFKIFRIDGTSTDIAYYIQAIKRKDPIIDFKQALRKVIEPQIISFKNKIFINESSIIKCPITGKYIDRKKCHIDHYYPTFDEIVNEFLEINNIINVNKIISKTSDNQIRTSLNDTLLAKSFYNFHREKANLRAISDEANLCRKKVVASN